MGREGVKKRIFFLCNRLGFSIFKGKKLNDGEVCF